VLPGRGSHWFSGLFQEVPVLRLSALENEIIVLDARAAGSWVERPVDIDGSMLRVEISRINQTEAVTLARDNDRLGRRAPNDSLHERTQRIREHVRVRIVEAVDVLVLDPQASRRVVVDL
jgi:hypothetical protein